MGLRRNGFSTLEALMALGILVAMTLASVTISLQSIKTSKKSKIIALGIAIESALLEAISNNVNYPTGIVNGPGGLLAGGLPEISLLSNYGTSHTGPAAQLFYKLRSANPPASRCFLDDGTVDATCTGKWVLKLEASYRLVSHDPLDLPRYGVAYFISGRPEGPHFRPFGLRTLSAVDFQPADFFFPIPQGVYSGEQKDYALGSVFGTCDVDEDAVISLFSVDLQSGKSGCVIKGSSCSTGQISTGLSASRSGSNVVLDFSCKPIQKCGCKNIEANNWQVTSFIPSNLVDQSKGSVCGQCEFAFKNSVPAKAYKNLAGMDVLENGICPSRHYDATTWDCKATAIWKPMWGPHWGEGNYKVKEAGCAPPTGPPTDPPASEICWPEEWFCAKYNPPKAENKVPVKSQAGGVVKCKVEQPDTAPLCGQYNYLIEPLGAAGYCQLKADKVGKKDAQLQ